MNLSHISKKSFIKTISITWVKIQKCVTISYENLVLAIKALQNGKICLGLHIIKKCGSLVSTYSDTLLNGLISEPGCGFIFGGSLSHGMFHSLKTYNVLDLYRCWDLTTCHFELLDLWFVLFFVCLFSFATHCDGGTAPNGLSTWYFLTSWSVTKTSGRALNPWKTRLGD